MHQFLLALISALLVSQVVTKENHHKKREVQDVCEVENSDAAEDACGMERAFAGSSVYPQLLSTFSPKAALYVQYRNIIVGGAQQLAPSRVATKPTLSMDFVQGPTTAAGAQMLSKKYAVFCLDFLPKGQTSKTVWLESGLKVDRNTGALTPTIAPIFPYKAPSPTAGTGTHEYVFLVFEETGAGLSGLLQRQPKLKASLSGPFSLKTFLAQSNLANSIVAGSFFKSTHP